MPFSLILLLRYIQQDLCIHFYFNWNKVLFPFLENISFLYTSNFKCVKEYITT